MNVISIGGGSLKKGQTLAIDRYIVKLAGKPSPRALFIPTASDDSPEYCETFDRIYGKRLRCQTDHLLLYRRTADRKAAARKIARTDIIYVGGGNTLRMMRMWRRLGIDRLLIRAGRKGTVLAGLSAGAICWHAWGHSDSLAYTGRRDWSYIKVRGLGIVPGLYCPHLDGERRHRSFKAMVARERMSGVACDNFAAIHYDGAGGACLSVRKNAGVHIYTFAKGRVLVESYGNRQRIELSALKPRMG